MEVTTQRVQKTKNTEMGCTLLMDQDHAVYVLDTAGDRQVAKFTMVGGYGGGSILPADTNVTSAVPFTLPDGDRSIVQLAKFSEDDAPKYSCSTV
jgi:hypothetical protein